MNRQQVYQILEDRMLGYADLVSVPVRPIQEKLVPISSMASLRSRPIDSDMLGYTGSLIYVREEIVKKLELASRLLKKNNPELRLEVVYGYRALDIQRKLFQKYMKRLENTYSGKQLLEATHRLIAVPEIAGHPTGGAVDIQIIKAGKPVSTGTKIWEFSPDSFTFSPFVSKQAQQNRLLLRNIMKGVGFAPFDGEWWHFSYGDKEWAKYYNKPNAIYEQVNFKSGFQKKP